MEIRDFCVIAILSIFNICWGMMASLPVGFLSSSSDLNWFYKRGKVLTKQIRRNTKKNSSETSPRNVQYDNDAQNYEFDKHWRLLSSPWKPQRRVPQDPRSAQVVNLVSTWHPSTFTKKIIIKDQKTITVFLFSSGNLFLRNFFHILLCSSHG